MASHAAWWRGREVLVVTAAPKEAGAIASAFGCDAPSEDWSPVDAGDGWSLVRSGVGKVNAAAAALRAIGNAGERPIVVNLGVCGALPGMDRVELRGVVIASEVGYADEGAMTPGGFVDISKLGFPLWLGGRTEGASCPTMVADPELRARLTEVLRGAMGEGVREGGITTVSMCSGTDGMARDVAARTGAIAEAMEGAAIAHALGPSAGVAKDFAEIRVVSNTTGDRTGQVWDLGGALEVLSRVARALRSA
jgi:futalosine hydrolase